MPADLHAVVAPWLAEAGRIALQWFRSDAVAEDKGAGRAAYDPVTEADRAIEDVLRAGISARFPDHEIVGEERGTTGPAGRYRWMIDPIDGTKAFVSGSPLWGTLLGLLDGGRPVAGWVHQPYLDESFAAVDGRAWVVHAGVRRPLACRHGVGLADAIVCATHPDMFKAETDRQAFARIKAAARLVRFGGDCYSYCLLAMGHVDLVVEASLAPYDILPLVPIIEAAGGVVTDAAGAVPRHGGFVVAAGSPELHAEAMALVGAPPGDS